MFWCDEIAADDYTRSTVTSNCSSSYVNHKAQNINYEKRERKRLYTFEV